MSSSEQAAPSQHNYLTISQSVRSWLLTGDHKRIAILYLLGVSFFFLIGGLFAVGIRLELVTPAGDFVPSDQYNRLFTMHGIVMVFFFLLTAIPAVLGNFLIPIMVGARDLAFPKINLLSWYLFMIGGLLTMWGIITGGIDTGWTFYTPLSTMYSNTVVVPVAIGIFVNGFAGILTGLNFIVTIHRMRAPGVHWGNLPLFVPPLAWRSNAPAHCHAFGLRATARSTAPRTHCGRPTVSAITSTMQESRSVCSRRQSAPSVQLFRGRRWTAPPRPS